MVETNPEITVLMPVYNGGKYIREAIQSILDQTEPNFILLIINDGSSDNSEEIIKSFNDPRIKYIKNEVNLRLGNTLNKGLDLATTKYIARMDQDDIAKPTRLEKEKKFLDSHPNIAIVGGGYAPFNENGHRIDIFHPKTSVEIAFRFMFNSYFCHPSVMFRKEILAKTGNYPDMMPEDYPFFSQIVKVFPGANIREILLDYRENPSGMSQTKAEEIRNTVIQISKKNYAFFRGSEAGYEKVIQYTETDNKKLSFSVMFHSSIIIWKIVNIYYPIPLNIYHFFKGFWNIVLLPQARKVKRYLKRFF
jgi:glycosyltransferase involved in cell wall biosynthesis